MAYRLLSLVVCLTVAGCSGVSNDDDFDVPTSSGDGDNPPVGTVTQSSFYVRAYDTGRYLTHTRLSSDFDTACEIASSDTYEDIVCYIDINEGDLYYNGIEFQYNVPANMCKYLTRSTYWYYNYEVGTGPATGTINIDKDSDTYTCDLDGAGSQNCSAETEVKLDADTGLLSCIYDHTLTDGPNCCMGSYEFDVLTTESATTTQSVLKGKWGGDIESCIGGPGKTSWEHYSKTGYPSNVITYADDGLNSTYSITAPIESPNGGTTWNVANFYTETGTPHSHTGFIDTVTTSSLPYFVAPIDDRNGSAVSTANIGYTFACLGESHEIKNRITVYVREWDVYSDFLTYITSSGVTSVPDRPDTDEEDTDCDGVDGYCNDDYDLDDFLNVTHSGSYDTSDPTTRSTLFPSQSHDD